MAITRATGAAASAMVAVVLLSAGCAFSARRSGTGNQPVRPPQHGSSSTSAPHPGGVPVDSLETAIGKIRELSMRARPAPKNVTGPTIESFDRPLAAALLALHLRPCAETHLRVAAEYVRLGVFDAAHRHYRAAIAFDPSSASAYDGLARLWRDSGLAPFALGDALRAVYYAPRSAEARNTLGTVLQALGRSEEARKAYEAALALEPGAAYARNNLGYLALLQGDAERAVTYCRAAVTADPALVAARHNLALAYASAGRMDLAEQALRAAGPPARADYNLGIINLARGRPGAALANFKAACDIDRTIPRACARADALQDRVPPAAGETPWR